MTADAWPELVSDVDILSQCSEYGPDDPPGPSEPVTAGSNVSLGLSAEDRELLRDLVSGFRAFNAGLERGLPTFQSVVAEMNSVVARFERLQTAAALESRPQTVSVTPRPAGAHVVQYLPPGEPSLRSARPIFGNSATEAPQAPPDNGNVVHVQEVPPADENTAVSFELTVNGNFDDLRLAEDGSPPPGAPPSAADEEELRLGDLPPPSSSATFIANDSKRTTRVDGLLAEPELPPSTAAPVVPAGNDAYLAEKYFQKGEKYRTKGDGRRAVACFSEAIRLNPRFVLALLERGQLYRSAKKPDLAITDFNTALEIEPDHAEGYLRRGNALADQGRIDEALEDYTAAIERDPSNAVTLVNRALAHSKQQNYDKAVVDADEAIRLNSHLASAYFVRGAAHSSQGNQLRASKDLDAAIKLEPKNPLIYNERGLVLARMEKYVDAVVNYSKAIRLAPGLHIARLNRAIAQRLGGDLELAIREFSAFVDHHPKVAEAYYQRGLAYREQKDFDAALADFDMVLELKPEHEEAEKAKIETDQVRRQGLARKRRPQSEEQVRKADERNTSSKPESTAAASEAHEPTVDTPPPLHDQKTAAAPPPVQQGPWRPSAASKKKIETTVDSDERPAWKRWAPYAAGVAATLVVGFFVTGYLWSSDEGEEYAQVLSLPPLVIIDSGELARRFTEEPAESESKYKNEVLEVMGIVQEIRTDGDGVSTVVLKDRKTSLSVDCVISTEPTGVASLGQVEKDKGKLISIKGVCQGDASGFKLVGCRLSGQVKVDRRGKPIVPRRGE